MIHITLKIGLIILTVLVGGCASHRLETYQALRDAEIQQPAYYYTEVEKEIADTESDSEQWNQTNFSAKLKRRC